MFKVSNAQELEMSNRELLGCALRNRINALRQKEKSGYGGDVTVRLLARYVELARTVADGEAV